MKAFVKQWIINTVAVLVAAHVVSGIHYDREDWMEFLLATFVLGIVNTFLRPILVILSLPLLLLSLGFFMIVINALLLFLVAKLFPSFQVDSFFPAAVLGAIVISIISLTLNTLTGSGSTRIEIKRGPKRPPPKGGSKNGLGGDGPVIDV